MVDNAVSTLTPDVRNSPAREPQVNPLNLDKEALFDSIAKESSGEEESASSPFKSVFTAFLWSGYAIAIVVAVILVWSAAKELLR